VVERHPKAFLSLRETNELIPDHDFPSTWDNSEGFGIPVDAPLGPWKECRFVRSIPDSLMDDPDDLEALQKIESIRLSMRAKDRTIPPVYVLHYANQDHPFFLIEGKHRFNAAHLEGSEEIIAWVRHADCCRSDEQ
jgi:hypothetical protein